MTIIPKPNIVEVFEHYGARVLGRDAGGWRKATCALLAHDDKSPSASVNEGECRWRCWSCDKGGDALDLIKENESIVGWAELVAFCQEKFGDGDGYVREERGSSSLFPRATGNQPRGSRSVPPWLRIK